MPGVSNDASPLVAAGAGEADGDNGATITFIYRVKGKKREKKNQKRNIFTVYTVGLYK